MQLCFLEQTKELKEKEAYYYKQGILPSSIILWG